MRKKSLTKLEEQFLQNELEDKQRQVGRDRICLPYGFPILKVGQVAGYDSENGFTIDVEYEVVEPKQLTQ